MEALTDAVLHPWRHYLILINLSWVRVTILLCPESVTLSGNVCSIKSGRDLEKSSRQTDIYPHPLQQTPSTPGSHSLLRVWQTENDSTLLLIQGICKRYLSIPCRRCPSHLIELYGIPPVSSAHWASPEVVTSIWFFEERSTTLL